LVVREERSVNLAVLIPFWAATITLTSGIVHVAFWRAPGWRVARASAAITLSAALYCSSAVPFGVDGLPVGVYLAVARLTYVAAFLHAIAWIVFAFGGPDGLVSAMPAFIRRLCAALLVVVAVVTATGVHLRHEVTTVDVAWAGVRYHYPVATPLGDGFGLIFPALMLIVFGRLVLRFRAGERELRWHIGGFAVLLGCATDEVLVANRVIVFLSMADFGIVAVVVPLTITMIRRLIADARRLADASVALEGEVRQRTEERDRAEGALVESERLAALGRLAAGVGHEVNNPLTYMQLALDDVRQYVAANDAPDSVREAIANAEDGARRIQKVVEGLRSYSRRQDAFELLDLREVARAAMKVAWPRLRHVAAVDTALGDVPLVMGDEPSLVQATVNLLTNAAQALTDSSRTGFQPVSAAPPRIVIRTGTAPDGSALLSVIDNGPGIPAELVTRISEPYFTTRSNAGGLGLGLFVTRGILDAHGGRFEVHSSEGTGTTVSIVLPAAETPWTDASRIERRPGVQPVASATGASPLERRGTEVPPVLSGAGPPIDFALVSTRGRLLLVDDEALVRDLLSRALGRSWDVTMASSGEEALRLLGGGRFDAVVCDLMMPGMSGMEMAETAWLRDPGLRRRTLFLTGGAIVPEAEAFLERSDVRYLTKPVRMAELNAVLQELVASAVGGAPGTVSLSGD
jgi:signal transduction histidine kinase/ActR/RegA family two-component response regulator